MNESSLRVCTRVIEQFLIAQNDNFSIKLVITDTSMSSSVLFIYLFIFHFFLLNCVRLISNCCIIKKRSTIISSHSTDAANCGDGDASALRSFTGRNDRSNERESRRTLLPSSINSVVRLYAPLRRV